MIHSIHSPTSNELRHGLYLRIPKSSHDFLILEPWLTLIEGKTGHEFHNLVRGREPEFRQKSCSVRTDMRGLPLKTSKRRVVKWEPRSGTTLGEQVLHRSCEIN